MPAPAANEVRFYYKLWARSLYVFLALYLMYALIKSVKGLPDEFNLGNMLLFLNVGFTAFFLYLLSVKFITWSDPVLKVGDSGVQIPKHVLRGYCLIPWSEIKGFGYKCGSLFRVKGIVLYLENSIINNFKNEQLILYGHLKDGDRAASLIESRLGERSVTAPVNMEVKDLSAKVSYRGMVFDSKGVHKRKKHIMWEQIEDVYYRNDSIAGYSKLELGYVDEDGTRRLIKLEPTNSREYLDIMRMVASYAVNARIDPAIKDAIAVPLEDARREETVFWISGLGVVICAFLSIVKPVIAASEGMPMWSQMTLLFALMGFGFLIIGAKKYRHRVLISTAYLAIVILIAWKI